VKDLNSPGIRAMISLLDDPDAEVFQQISRELIAMGREVVPMLEETWGNVFDPVMQSRIENIVHKIQFDTIRDELIHWAATGGTDLLNGAFIIARYQYPDLDEDATRKELNRIKKTIWVELSEYMTPQEKIMVMNRILFEREGFTGNTANFHAPQNSFINTVVETRKGNPLLLSIIYIILARQLDIPVYGVNLPEHFILAYQDNRGTSPETYTYPEAGIIFYINAFSKGTIFLKKDIDLFLRKLNLEFNHTYYEPCSNIEMIRRIVHNLSFSWQKLGQTEKSMEISELLNCLRPNQLPSPD